MSRDRMGLGPGDACRLGLRAAVAALRVWASRVALWVVFVPVLGFVVASGADAKGTLDTIRVDALPPAARTVLVEIHAGGPFGFARDGIVFANRERLLPSRPRGYYAEYTVPTPGERTRGARRIIAGRGTTGDFRTSDEYYYTDDHYESFRRIVQ